MDIYDMIEIFVLSMVGCLIFFALRRIIFRKKDREKLGKNYWFREIVMTLFVAYLIFLGCFTWLYDMNIINNPFYTAWYKIRRGYGINIIPFKTIRFYFTYTEGQIFIINIWGNIIMFLPWGIALPILWERYRNYPKMALMSLAFSMVIETGQLFVGRNVDIDDVIINAPSSFIAAVITIIIIRRLDRGKGNIEK